MATTRDYSEIRLEYVTGEVSLRELAEKYELSNGAIMELAARENWVEQREQHRSKVAQSVRERIAAAQSVQRYEASTVIDTMVAEWMRKAKEHKANVTSFDVVNALRFREVLEGRVDSRAASRQESVEERAKSLGTTVDALEAWLEEQERANRPESDETN